VRNSVRMRSAFISEPSPDVHRRPIDHYISTLSRD
jgi:hypothetical protein